MVTNFPDIPTNRWDYPGTQAPQLSTKFRWFLLFSQYGGHKLSFRVIALTKDFEVGNEFFDKEDFVFFSAVRCFMRRDLNRIHGYSEVTISTYAPRKFWSHFRMTRGTCEVLCREIFNTGRIPTGYTRSWQPPAKTSAGDDDSVVYSVGDEQAGTTLIRRHIEKTTKTARSFFKRAWKRKNRSNGTDISNHP